MTVSGAGNLLKSDGGTVNFNGNVQVDGNLTVYGTAVMNGTNNTVGGYLVIYNGGSSHLTIN